MNRPPKNITSVTRKTHMPSVEASRCWAMLSKWCCRCGVCEESTAVVSGNFEPPLGVRVSALGDDGRLEEVLTFLLCWSNATGNDMPQWSCPSTPRKYAFMC